MQSQYIEAEVVILSSDQGGRAVPLSALGYGGGYRPHIVIQPRNTRQANIEMRDGMNHITDDYIGVAFWSGPQPMPIDSPFNLSMRLMYAPHPSYDQVTPGQEFTIREGPVIVGHGRVTRRWTEGGG